LVAASSKRAAGAAAKLFRERKARKTYLAIVFGHPESDEWSCDAPMGKDPDDPKGFREKVDESETGKACETRFEVLQRGVCALEGKYKGTPVSKVRVTPVTGRRHQIRVHLMHSGHPIVGDNAYSEDRDSFRTFLHAHVLEMPFEPPKNERNLPPVVPEEWVTHRWVAPEPESFAAAIE
jgi:tRNA pseudouridine32 synthase/23S rRNA pseudouridine746 synthase